MCKAYRKCSCLTVFLRQPLPACALTLSRACCTPFTPFPQFANMNLSGNQDWDTVVLSKKRPNA